MNNVGSEKGHVEGHVRGCVVEIIETNSRGIIKSTQQVFPPMNIIIIGRCLLRTSAKLIEDMKESYEPLFSSQSPIKQFFGHA